MSRCGGPFDCANHETSASELVVLMFDSILHLDHYWKTSHVLEGELGELIRFKISSRCYPVKVGINLSFKADAETLFVDKSRTRDECSSYHTNTEIEGNRQHFLHSTNTWYMRKTTFSSFHHDHTRKTKRN